jgi:hypothetical protein
MLALLCVSNREGGIRLAYQWRIWLNHLQDAAMTNLCRITVKPSNLTARRSTD